MKREVSLLFVLAINLIKLNAVDAIVLYSYRPIIRTWGEVRYIGRSAVGLESPGQRRYVYLDYEIILCWGSTATDPWYQEPCLHAALKPLPKAV